MKDKQIELVIGSLLHDIGSLSDGRWKKPQSERI